MKIIIAGGREFKDFELLCEKMDFYDQNKVITEIVSGGARGADKLGEKWGELRHIPRRVFVASWGLYGKRAGIMRNKQMGQYANALVAFWDGVSRGTKHMIEYMEELGKPVRVVRYD